MTAHNCVAESHTGATGSTSEASFTFNLDPTSTLRGVQVVVVTLLATPKDTGVTAGGLDMQPKYEAWDTAGEPAFLRIYELDVPPTDDPLAIVVNRVNDGTTMYAVAVGQTGSTDIVAGPFARLNEQGTYAEVTLDDGSPGVDSVRYAAGFYGTNDVPTAGANSTTLIDIDFGNFTFRLVRETTAGQGARSVGFTEGVSDDRAMIAWVAREQSEATAGVFHEYSSLSHQANGAVSQSEASFSWEHVSLDGVQARVDVMSQSAAKDTGVTYGGEAMTLDTGLSAADTAAEPGAVRVYVLDDPPLGRQTVTVTRTNDANAVWAVASTVRASGPVEIHTAGSVQLQENGTFAEQTLTPTSADPSVLAVAAWCGGSGSNVAIGSHTMETGENDFAGASFRTGVTLFSGTGARDVGLVYAVSDDRAATHYAIQLQPVISGGILDHGDLVKNPTSHAAGSAGTPAGAFGVRSVAKFLAGASAPAGTLIRSLPKYLTGSAGTPAGSLVKTVPRAFTGDAGTPAGAIVRTPTKVLDGDAGTPAGDLTPTPEYGDTTEEFEGDAGTPEGSLVRTASTHHAGSAGTPAGALIRTGSQYLAGSAGAPTGSLVRSVAKLLTGSAGTPAGAIVRIVTKILAGNADIPAGSLVRVAVKVLGSTVTAAGSLVRSMPKYFTGDAGTPAGSVVREARTHLAGELEPTGDVTTTQSSSQFLDGSIDTAGELHRAAVVHVAGSFEPAGSVAFDVEAATRAVDGAIAPTGQLRRTVFVRIGGSFLPVGSVTTEVDLANPPFPRHLDIDTSVDAELVAASAASQTATATAPRRAGTASAPRQTISASVPGHDLEADS